VHSLWIAGEISLKKQRLPAAAQPWRRPNGTKPGKRKGLPGFVRELPRGRDQKG